MNDKDFLSYYKNEINILRDVGKQYAQKQPLIASYLNETSKDPDTERLIEATAFLNANLKKELDSSFDIFSSELIDIMYPDFIKSKPSICIMKLTPQEDLSEIIDVPKHTYFKSKKIKNHSYKFKTCWDTQIHPIMLSNVKYNELKVNNSILKIDFNSLVSLSGIELSYLDFFINMSLANSYILTKLLMFDIESIYITSNNQKIKIENKDLINLGFEDEFNLFSYKKKTLNKFKILNEYFSYSRKDLFFRINNLKKYFNNISSDNFSIEFNFSSYNSNLDQIKTKDLVLYAVPTINIYKLDTEPIKINYINEKIKIITSYSHEDEIIVYDVNEVKGLKSSKNEKSIYSPFNGFNNSPYTYKLSRKKSLGDFRKDETFIEVFYEDIKNIDDILSINANVTNGSLCENLKIDDINMHTENSPEYCEFSNITIPSIYIESPVESKKLSFIISHLSTNIFGISNIEDFKNILKFYINDNSRNKENNKINLNKIESLQSIDIKISQRLNQAKTINTYIIKLSLDSSSFVNSEDMYIFSYMIFKFFKYNTPINHLIYIQIKDIYTGNKFEIS